MINFLHSYNPQPELLSFGPITIHWYGLMLALGFLAGVSLLHVLFKKYGRNEDDIYTMLLYIVIPALLGARLYYVIYAWEFYAQDFIGIFRVWEGGLAIHGVILGGVTGLYLYTKKFKDSFWGLLDILAPCLVIGQIIGRWGNYFNQELHGTPTDLPWGIPIQSPPVGFEAFIYFHPTFLYEGVLNLLIFIVLIAIHKAILNKQSLVENIKSGTIFLIYIILYSCVRFIMEYFRIDYSPLVFGIRWAQIMSIFLAGVSTIILIYKYRKQK